MAINWQDVITTVGGQGVLLAAAAWLFKAIVSNRLVLDLEKFKIELKADADTEIERVKAFLTRESRVHESQVNTLTKLYRHFYVAQGYLQRLAASARFTGEVPDEEYRRLLTEAIVAARDELSESRLLIPSDLAQKCDEFFKSLFEGQSQLAYAQNPIIIDGLQRKEFWDSAQKNAYQEVPTLLLQIEKAARAVIHGEQAPKTT